jgi:hypothetical protein
VAGCREWHQDEVGRRRGHAATTDDVAFYGP